jgi:Ca-activated chloride channel family protein
MIQHQRFGFLLISLLATVPAPYAAAGAAQPKRAPGAAPAPRQGSATPGKGGGTQRAVLVLDASGSMSILDSGSTPDKLGSETRMKVAKNAVQQLIERWDLEVPLGLTAYGHRNNGCQDIEILVPVGPVDRARFLRAVGELQPKGSSPLTAAMVAAAEQLDYTARQATVILVSDGAESCRLDPCAVASSLEAKGVDLTVHVVGFGVSAEVRESKLSCIAKNTGGQYRTASDAESLASALTGLVSDAGKPAGSDQEQAIRPQAALEARLSRARGPRPRKTPRARCSGP